MSSLAAIDKRDRPPRPKRTGRLRKLPVAVGQPLLANRCRVDDCVTWVPPHLHIVADKHAKCVSMPAPSARVQQLQSRSSRQSALRRHVAGLPGAISRNDGSWMVG
jgi:hypothetical protein